MSEEKDHIQYQGIGTEFHLYCLNCGTEDIIYLPVSPEEWKKKIKGFEKKHNNCVKN